MQIGILSDTHDNLSNYLAALEIFKKEGVSTLIHCGDITEPEMVQHLNNFRVIYLYGNMDVGSGIIHDAILKLNPDNYAGILFTGALDGVMVAATHGHLDGVINSLATSGQYTYVFHGHTHRRRNEKIKTTQVINPGALGGLHVEDRSVCLVDLDKGKVRHVKVAD